MKIYLIHTNGIISSAIHSTAEPPLTTHLEIDFQGDLGQLLTEYYIQDNELVYIGPAPTFAHKIVPGVGWVPQIEIAIEHKSADIDQELNRRLYLPCNGFDADNVSRARISGMIARLQRGDGLPSGWVGWRDFSNQQQWATDDAATVLANLTALSRAIEDREQALLIAAWTHKAAISSLADIDGILAYDVTAGWPA